LRLSYPACQDDHLAFSIAIDPLVQWTPTLVTESRALPDLPPSALAGVDGMNTDRASAKILGLIHSTVADLLVCFFQLRYFSAGSSLHSHYRAGNGLPILLPQSLTIAHIACPHASLEIY
jgi:hypothetical protein